MIWLSLGENCLPDSILHRFGMKSFSTPFSHGRTNIEYATQADAENFASLLDQSLLYSVEAYGKPVVRNNLYSCDKSLYDASVASDFEFTHHDVIKGWGSQESYKRKIQRWNDARQTADEVRFLYHHRDWHGKNIQKLTEKLRDFQVSYSRDGARCSIVLLEQNIQPDQPRDWSVSELSTDLVHARLTTKYHWSGNDEDVFWGRVDNDLLQASLNRASEILGAVKIAWTATG